MKKRTSFLIIGLSVFVLAGCGQPKPTIAGQKYYKWTSNESFAGTDIKVLNKKPLAIQAELYVGNSYLPLNLNYTLLLKEIGNIGLAHNYNYFSLVNYKMNNLLGFPLNKPNSLAFYCMNGGDCRGSYTPKTVYLDAVYFKNKPKDVFSWNIKDVEKYTPRILCKKDSYCYKQSIYVLKFLGFKSFKHNISITE